MKKIAAIVALIALLGCGTQKVTKAPAGQPQSPYIQKINELLKTAEEYHIPQAVPDLWEGIKIYTESAKKLCTKKPQKCPEFYQTIKKAVLSGIKITRLMENAP